MKRQHTCRTLMQAIACTVLACLLTDMGASAAELPQDLNDALAACRNAPQKVTLALLDQDANPAKRFAFGKTTDIDISTSSSQSLRSLTVWAGSTQRLQIREAELRSFDNNGFRTRISLLRTVASAGTAGAVPASGDKALPLDPGQDNKVTVVAWTDVNGSDACGSFEGHYRMASIDTFALVIGFNYTEMEQRLKYASNDAAAIVNHLVDALAVKEENIWFFTDDTATVAALPPKVNSGKADTPQSIRATVSEILARADPQSSLYVYFSGHMVWPDDATDPRRGPAFVLPHSKIDDLDSMLNRSTFILSVSASDLSTVAVILDACFSGTVVSAHAASASPGPPGAKSWRRPASAVSLPGEIWTGRGARLASSKGSDPSWELEQFRHGVFTHFLLTAGRNKPSLKLGEAMDEAAQAMGSLKPEGWTQPLKQEPSKAYFEGGENIPWRVKP